MLKSCSVSIVIYFSSGQANLSSPIRPGASLHSSESALAQHLAMPLGSSLAHELHHGTSATGSEYEVKYLHRLRPQTFIWQILFKPPFYLQATYHLARVLALVFMPAWPQQVVCWHYTNSMLRQCQRCVILTH